MANSSLIKPTEPPKPINLLSGESYKLCLTKYMQELVAETRKLNPNLSPFLDTFYELMQNKIDPPLETIWAYSALTFRSLKNTKDDLLDRASNGKMLFHIVCGCSASCSPYKSIAMLAPVVLEVFKLLKELFMVKDLGAKRVKKAVKEVKSLIGEVLGYISVCSSISDVSEGVSDMELVAPFADLVSVWMDGKEEGMLRSFLPVVSGDMCRGIGDGGEFSGDHLAGIVIAEVFLLKLCLDLRVGNRGPELEKQLRSWVVGSMTGSQSFHFFDIILTMLLEPTLPVTSLLTSEDEILLRAVLYDAVVLVEYSFLGSEKLVRLPAEKVRSLLLKRLIVTCEATEFLRKCGDQKKGILYSASFSNSRFSFQVIKHVTHEIGMDELSSKLKGSSPKALLKWLFNLENQGLRLFDDSISKYRTKFALEDASAGYEKLVSKSGDSKSETDFLFYIDNKGEEENGGKDDKETNEAMSAAFVAAAHTMRLSEDGERKRKGGGSAGKRKRSKFVQLDHSDNSDADSDGTSSVSGDESSSDSEVDSPVSGEDI